MRTRGLLAVAAACGVVALAVTARSQTTVVDLGAILSNAGFEDDLSHVDWTATKKNGNYRLNAPVVNPILIPKDHVVPLDAPAGNNFVGVLNPMDADINGRLVHEVIAQAFDAGTVFEITVFGSRGRLSTAPISTFAAGAGELTFQFFVWGPGTPPVLVSPDLERWSRGPSALLRQVFTSWAANGEWASQKLQFVPAKPVRYFTLSITGKNHQSRSYVAFDVLTPE